MKGDLCYTNSSGLHLMNVSTSEILKAKIAPGNPDGCHALWCSPEFYYALLERGMVTFEHDAAVALFMDMELRVVQRLGCDYKVAKD